MSERRFRSHLVSESAARSSRREKNRRPVRWTGMPFVLLYLVVEIVAVVALGSWIGALPTLLVLLAGSVLGLWLARREWVRAAQALAEAARNRRVATSET